MRSSNIFIAASFVLIVPKINRSRKDTFLSFWISLFANDKKCYAIGEGLLNISKDGVTLLLESIESKDDIDIDRAKDAKKRAEERLATLVNIDVERAQRALNRANNRISVYENDD